MEIFKKINFKQFFTLIELIVVIVVLGVLAAIVIPNISSFKEEAQETAIKADARNIQTAVDMFMLDYHGTTPTKEKATLGNPQIVELYGLKPDYLRDLPKEGESKFWLDENNTVWGSKVDAPVNVTYDNENQILSWDTVDGATLYKVYKAGTGNEISSSANSSSLTHLKDIKGQKGGKQEISLAPLSKGVYLVTALDKFTHESVAVGSDSTYKGYGEGPDKNYQNPEEIPSQSTEKELYAFTSATFTNAGGIGKTGPTQSNLDSTYVNSVLSGKVISDNGIQLWTVPKTGRYQIEAYGAQGGGKYVKGGKGAYIKGEFDLLLGQELKILVGQKPLDISTSVVNSGSSGGGGSFIATNDNLPLLVAGGGGGASKASTSTGIPSSGATSLNGTGPNNSTNIKTGFGSSGNGAESCGAGCGGGGAGFFTDGKHAYNWSTAPTQGKAFVNGGAGGSCIYSDCVGGGFGGGGGNAHSGGGGGGYSGGSPGYWGPSTTYSYNEGGHGGGGGSYNAGQNKSSVAGVNIGHGKVIITHIDN